MLEKHVGRDSKMVYAQLRTYLGCKINKQTPYIFNEYLFNSIYFNIFVNKTKETVSRLFLYLYTMYVRWKYELDLDEKNVGKKKIYKLPDCFV